MSIEFSSSNVGYGKSRPKMLIEKYVKSKSEDTNGNYQLTYTILLKNISDFNLESVCVVEDIIEGLRYMTNSLRINGDRPIEGDINLREERIIPIGFVGENSQVEISFDVIVDEIPNIYPITNYARVLYKYYENNKAINDIQTSNIVYSDFDLSQKTNGFEQYIDNDIIVNKDIYDDINIKLVIQPYSTIENAMLYDYLNDLLEFKYAEVIYTNGRKFQIDKDPGSINLGTISAKEKVEVVIHSKIKYESKVISIPYITNKPSIKYIVYGKGIASSFEANTVYIYINTAKIKTSVKVEKEIYNGEEISNILIDLNNYGNIQVQNIRINNILSDNMRYINNSSTIAYEGILKSSINYNGKLNMVEIPVLDRGESATVSIKAKSKEEAYSLESKVLSNLYLDYMYLKDPSHEDRNKRYNFIQNEFVISKFAEAGIKKDKFIDNKSKVNSCDYNCSCDCDCDCNDSADLLSTLTKRCSNEVVCKCSKIDYTISFTNTGNITAKNIIIEDILENGEFEEGSLKVFTNRPPGAKLFSGKLPKIRIEEVYPRETITISFSASVSKYKKCKSVTNYARIYYEYYKNNCNKPTRVDGKTNLVITNVEEDKIASALYIEGLTSYQTEVNDEVNYKIIIKNTSSTTLVNVSYKLNLSLGYENYIRYKPSSLKINGNIITPDINPNTTPIDIGTINPGETIIVEFIEITLKPTTTPIVSFAQGVYTYQVNHLVAPVTCSDTTNSAALIIVPAMVELSKDTFSYCPPNEIGCIAKPINTAGVGDRITYKITIKNTSSNTLENVVFNDTIPSNMEYVKGSLKINGVSVPYDIEHNLPIGNIPPNATVIISFDVIIKSLPITGEITNIACVKYDYLIDSKNCIRKTYTTCASDTIDIKYADLISITPTKVSDTPVVSRTDPSKSYGNYIVTLTNSGNEDALNVKVVDTLPNGLTFVPNSVVVTGTDKNGAVVPLVLNSIPPGGPLNIENGIIIEKIPPLVKVTIKYGYIVNSNAPNVIDNIANFDYSYLSDGKLISKNNNQTTNARIIVIDDILAVNKEVLPTTICPGGTLLYTVNIRNICGETINNVTLQDTIPNGTTLVPSSFTVNLKPFTIGGKPVTSDQLAQGVNIGSINELGSKFIQFQINVGTGSISNPIVNRANVWCKNTTIPSNVYSSIAITTIPSNCSTPLPTTIINLSKEAFSFCPPNSVGCIVKPITTAGVGDTITYKVTIANVSPVNAENVLFNDVVPINTTYIKNSLKINGVTVPYDLQPNLQIGNIAPNSVSTISFDVVVNSIPSSNTMTNTACVNYEYLVNLVNCDRKNGKTCATNTTKVNSADLISVTPTKVSDTPVVSRTDPSKGFGNYIVTLTNSGNEDALNVKVVDTLPNGLTFVSNSVVVTGTDKNGVVVPLVVNSIPPGGPLNIENGIIIQSIPPLVKVTIKYGYTVNLNAPNLIDNIANFDYSYLSDGQLISKANNDTTKATILVVDDVLRATKTVLPTTICPGGTLLYTVDIKNLSGQIANNVILQDTIPSGTTLVPSSFTVDLKPFTIGGNPVTSAQLAQGINIGSINADSSKIAQFQVNVGANGVTNPIVNKVNIKYQNTTVPSNVYSSIAVATIPANCPVPPEKLVDLSKNAFSYCPPNQVGCIIKPITSVSVGDRITYEVTVDNVSNINLINVLFNDTLPSSITYVPGTLKIDGVTVSSGLIPNLPIGTIPANDSSIVSFDVIVNTLPNPSTITNYACTTYSYQINCPNCETKTSTSCTSNNLNVISPDLITNFKKYVDKVGQTENYKAPGYELGYILNIQNNGNATALNTILIDTLPDYVGYLAGTVTVTPSIPRGNITEPTSEIPALRIKFDTLPVGQSYSVQFQTIVSVTITSATIKNHGELDYSYQSSSSGNLINTSVSSNTTTTYVNSADLELTKEASASEVDINVPVTYTINAKNLGNIVANNIFVKDVLPPFVAYIPNTLRVNGVPSSDDINAGILLGSLQPYNSITNRPIDTISFQVEATTTPALNPIVNTAFAQYTYVPDPTTGKEINTAAQSNQVFLTIIAADLISETPRKESSVLVVSPSDPANNTGTYTTTLYNAGNTNALNVVVRDTIPNGLTFNPGSVVVVGTDKNGNNVPLVVNSIPPGGPLNIQNGISIASIAPGVTVKVTFGYTAAAGAPPQIDNTANFDYSYIVTNTIVNKPNNQTNQVSIFTTANSLDVNKYVTPTTVCPGQTLLYTVKIKNKVAQTINNLVIQDTIPSGTNLVPNSFLLNLQPYYINGNPVTGNNLAQGVNIGSIPIGNSSVVQFLVNVNNTTVSNPIVNIANVSFTSGVTLSQIFSSTAIATIATNCPSPCPICPICPVCPTIPHPHTCPHVCIPDCNRPCCQCNQCQCDCDRPYQQDNDRPCPHYGKSSCRPGKRQICRQNVSCWKECADSKNYRNR